MTVINQRHSSYDKDRPKATYIKDQVQMFKLYLGYIPDIITEKDLHDYFSSYGNVKSVEIRKKESIKNAYNYGSVAFSDATSAERALLTSKHYICKRMIRIRRANGWNQPGLGVKKIVILVGVLIIALLIIIAFCMYVIF